MAPSVAAGARGGDNLREMPFLTTLINSDRADCEGQARRILGAIRTRCTIKVRFLRSTAFRPNEPGERTWDFVPDRIGQIVKDIAEFACSCPAYSAVMSGG